jgi:hypothetical protein
MSKGWRTFPEMLFGTAQADRAAMLCAHASFRKVEHTASSRTAAQTTHWPLKRPDRNRAAQAAVTFRAKSTVAAEMAGPS